MHILGIPEKLADYLLEKAGTPDLALEADLVRVDLVRGIIAEPVQIYQKRVVAPPVMLADEVQIIINPLALLRNKQPVRHVRIIGAKLESTFKRNTSVNSKKRSNSTDENIKFKLEIINGCWRELCINSFIADVDISQKGWDINDISLTMSDSKTTGQAWGHIKYCKTDKLLSGEVKTKLDPNILIPLLKVVKMKFLPILFSRFEVGNILPYCNGTFSKELYKGGPLVVNAYVEFEEGKYRGVYLTKAETELNITSKAGEKAVVTLDPLIARRDDGTANLKLVVDANKRKVHFDGTLIDVDAKAVCGYIGILTNGFFNTIKLESPLIAKATGFFDYGDKTKTDFNINIKSKRIYAKKIYADDVQLLIKGDGLTNYVENLNGNMCDGQITADGYVFAPSHKTSTNQGAYKFNIKLDNVQFDKLVKVFNPYTKSKYNGFLSVNTDLCGHLEKDFINSMKGTGHIGIKNGQVFSLPIFGGLSKFISKIIPGLDFVMRQSNAKTDFTISNGKAHTDKLRIEGDVLSLTGDGDYYFNKKLDFDIRVKLLKSHTLVGKILGTITYPISKLFEFTVTGTLDNPEWKPVNFSSELLKRIGLKKND